MDRGIIFGVVVWGSFGFGVVDSEGGGGFGGCFGVGCSGIELCVVA